MRQPASGSGLLKKGDRCRGEPQMSIGPLDESAASRNGAVAVAWRAIFAAYRKPAEPGGVGGGRAGSDRRSHGDPYRSLRPASPHGTGGRCAHRSRTQPQRPALSPRQPPLGRRSRRRHPRRRPHPRRRRPRQLCRRRLPRSRWPKRVGGTRGAHDATAHETAPGTHPVWPATMETSAADP
jgi:hypothetical protein